MPRQMRARNFVFVGIIGLIILAVWLIFATLPAKVSDTGPSGTQPSPTVDTTEHLSGGHLDGQLLFTRAGNLWAWRGNEARRLAVFPGKSVVANNKVQLLDAVWSPNQSQLAYIRQDESFADLWVVNADGSAPRKLTDDSGTGVPRSDNFAKSSLWAFSPTWSPDGSQLAYLADVQTDDLALWLIPAKGGQSRKVSDLGTGQGGMQHLSWSPTGNQIAVAAFSNGKSQIYVINPTNGTPVQITNAADGAYDPAFSPDGKFIAYTQRKGQGSELWLVATTEGSNPVFIAPGPTRAPAWSPDGSKIAYLHLEKSSFEIYEIGVGTKGQVGPQGTPQQISNDAQVDATGGLSWGK